jgi:hypothetical protein
MLDRYPYYYRKGKIKTLQQLSSPSLNHIPIWLERVRQNLYFDEFGCYLFGSLVEEEKGDDLDIFFTGEYLPEILVDLMDNSLRIAFDMGIKMDVFYIPDYSYLDLPPNSLLSNSYNVYTNYDFELEVVKGKVSMFRDYGKTFKDGLYLHQHSPYHKPSLDRGQKKRYIKLN